MTVSTELMLALLGAVAALTLGLMRWVAQRAQHDVDGLGKRIAAIELRVEGIASDVRHAMSEGERVATTLEALRAGLSEVQSCMARLEGKVDALARDRR